MICIGGRAAVAEHQKLVARLKCPDQHPHGADQLLQVRAFGNLTDVGRRLAKDIANVSFLFEFTRRHSLRVERLQINTRISSKTSGFEPEELIDIDAYRFAFYHDRPERTNFRLVT